MDLVGRQRVGPQPNDPMEYDLSNAQEAKLTTLIQYN